MQQRILSGVRPTGGIHIGNYLGAIKNWVRMQNDFQDNLFCVVDLHALTTLTQLADLKGYVYEVTAAYLACGIDPKKSTIFKQSTVPGHTQLNWIFSCLTPLGWLNRMTQFKEKAGKHKEQACLGLYAYPVLMAADILLYEASHVPVGDDQKQHLELARDIAGAFNRQVGQEIFTLPEPVILQASGRVMSLRDGTSKMSKSDSSEYSCIFLMDDADKIALKIRKARTDSEPLPGDFSLLEGREEAKNLVSIYAALSEKKPDEICIQFEGALFSRFKQDLTDLLVEKITPIGKKMSDYLQDTSELDRILNEGAHRANEISVRTIEKVYSNMGLR